MALNFTQDEIKARKEKAIALLNTHTDKYRTFYAEIVSKDVTGENLESLELKRKMLEIESDSIHTQIKMLNELDYYARNDTVTE